MELDELKQLVEDLEGRLDGATCVELQTFERNGRALKLFIVRSKVKTTAFRRSDLSLKPFARRVSRDGVSIR